MSAPYPILLVDDNPQDYQATKRSLQQIGISNPLMYCADGDEALDLLLSGSRKASPANPLPRPCLILLDLNLPGTDGREVLKQLKQNDQLKSIPVVVLTTSSDTNDIEDCYRRGANSYVIKPVDYDGLVSDMRALCDFWLGVARLPALS